MAEASKFPAIYSTAELAAALNVSEESIRREIRRGHLQAMRIGRQYRATPKDLIHWLGKNRYNELFGNSAVSLSDLSSYEKDSRDSKGHKL